MIDSLVDYFLKYQTRSNWRFLLFWIVFLHWIFWWHLADVTRLLRNRRMTNPCTTIESDSITCIEDW